MPHSKLYTVLVVLSLVLATHSAPLTDDSFCHKLGGKCGDVDECAELKGTAKSGLCVGPKSRQCCTDIPEKPEPTASVAPRTRPVTRTPETPKTATSPSSGSSSWWDKAKAKWNSVKKVAGQVHEAVKHYSGYNYVKKALLTPPKPVSTAPPAGGQPEVPVPPLNDLFGGRGGDASEAGSSATPATPAEEEEAGTPTPTPKPMEEYKANQCFKVIASSLNYREKPNGKKIGKLTHGDVYCAVETGKGWLKVKPARKVSSVAGYVYGSPKYIQRTFPVIYRPTTLPGFIGAKTMSYCIIERTALRDGPNPAASRLLGTMPEGLRCMWLQDAFMYRPQTKDLPRPFVKISYLVQSERYTGWVEASTLRDCSPNSPHGIKYKDLQNDDLSVGNTANLKSFKLQKPKLDLSALSSTGQPKLLLNPYENEKAHRDALHFSNFKGMFQHSRSCVIHDAVATIDPDPASEIVGIIPEGTIVAAAGLVPRLGTSGNVLGRILRKYRKATVVSLRATLKGDEEAQKLIGKSGYLHEHNLGVAPCQYNKREEDAALQAAHNARAHKGAWVPAPCAMEEGDKNQITYNDSPAWGPGKTCKQKGPTNAVEALTSYLTQNFPGISYIGGYSCRPNTADTSKMSVHGSGRAMDIMIPLVNMDADNSVGDPIANWLVQHSKVLGIQYIAWDRWSWGGSRAPGKKARKYGGPNPHIDHLHVEINEAAAKAGAEGKVWFEPKLSDQRCWRDTATATSTSTTTSAATEATD
eukprot:TRINITY_DN1414_c0_g1_i5.p1 TRINITY_DN1414_c0_g1~~TRINITY_DN1414_c0_g1_i5.p1  ORF type:complete len:753 (-),score=161.60 TRINITY_DN1414_c0_g1_i5:507-2765(-)